MKSTFPFHTWPHFCSFSQFKMMITLHYRQLHCSDFCSEDKKCLINPEVSLQQAKLSLTWLASGFGVFTCPGAFLRIWDRTNCLKMRESECSICWLLGSSTENMVCRESVPFAGCWEAMENRLSRERENVPFSGSCEISQGTDCGETGCRLTAAGSVSNSLYYN